MTAIWILLIPLVALLTYAFIARLSDWAWVTYSASAIIVAMVVIAVIWGER